MNGRTNDKWGNMWMEAIMVILKRNASICLEQEGKNII
jgi:hypothetical protein